MSEKGTSHFVAQRLSAMVMIPLVIWFLIALISHAGDSHAELITWLSTHPWTATVPLILLIVFGFFHMRLGVEVVIDDYIHHPDRRGILHFLNTLFALILAAISTWSLIAITFIG